VWEWYSLLCFLAVLNLVLYVLVLRTYPLDPDPARARYQRVLRALALPMVVQCAWRGVFPSLYLQRYAFWDTELNAILVDRTFACVGELAWNAQLAITFWHIDSELTAGGTRWVRLSAVTLVVMYVVAEAVSYYNTATTNELYAAIEVALDAASQLVALPAALALAAKLPSPRRFRASSAGVLLA
jgi:hypothetical protein